MVWKALSVELIRLLWEEGLYRQNPILRKIHENWLSFWVEWKTQKTMKDVDRQIQGMFEESEIFPPVFNEDKAGETLLGGKIELRAPWLDEDDD
jgi:hypothetical protein